MILVESKAAPSKENDKWKMISKIFDRLVFLILIVVYFIMVVALIPENYGNELVLDAIDADGEDD